MRKRDENGEEIDQEKEDFGNMDEGDDFEEGSYLINEIIDGLIQEESETELSDIYGAQTRTFMELGLLTKDQGLVLKLEDGSEYQITIRRSK